MLALLRWLIGLLFAACILTFAVLNRDVIPFYYSPIHDPLEFPVYAIGLALLATGYAFGALSIWLNDSDLRRARRKQRREIKALSKELDEAKPHRHDKIFKDKELQNLLPAKPDTSQ